MEKFCAETFCMCATVSNNKCMDSAICSTVLIYVDLKKIFLDRT
jgi:hypothetical protein